MQHIGGYYGHGLLASYSENKTHGDVSMGMDMEMEMEMGMGWGGGWGWGWGWR